MTKPLPKKRTGTDKQKVLALPRRKCCSQIISRPDTVDSTERRAGAAHPKDARFAEVLALIEKPSGRPNPAVMVDLYWKIGASLSQKIERAAKGERVVDELAAVLARRFPDLPGYKRRNLFRMRQFFESYRGHEKVLPRLAELPWTHHVMILSHTKCAAEREFYISSAIKEVWTTRELERQIKSCAILRTAPSEKQMSTALANNGLQASDELKNSYSLDFLSLPDVHSEADLHKGLLDNIVCFIKELGRDFCFVGSEYPVHVGQNIFEIDLVFFNRALQCLVAIDLKVRKFEPADLGQLSFYLEALDRDVKKVHERPSIGVLLCSEKDDEVVEYALAGTASATLVADYLTMLPSKEVLRRKLRDLREQLSESI